MEFNLVEYSGREYLCIPCMPLHLNACECICENMSLVILPCLNEYDVSGRIAFTDKILQRIDRYEQLEYNEKKFYNDAFISKEKIKASLVGNDDLIKKFEKLVELINLVYSRETSRANEKLLELTNGLFKIQDGEIYKKSKIDNVFGMSKFILESLEVENMGIFDKFLKESTSCEKFYKFVSGMSEREILNAITEEYYKLKGTSNLSPYAGNEGSFEFAGALLLWRYANKQLKASSKEINIYGPLLISLADAIGCSFNHMSPLEWSDKIDIVINESNDVLTYSEWSKVFRYLKDNYSIQIRQFEFNTVTIYQRTEYDRMYDKFTVLYNSLPNFKSVIGVSIIL